MYNAKDTIMIHTMKDELLHKYSIEFYRVKHVLLTLQYFNIKSWMGSKLSALVIVNVTYMHVYLMSVWLQKNLIF